MTSFSRAVGEPPCLIVNPLSARASRGGLAARGAALAKRAGLEVIEFSGLEPLRAALEDLRSRRQKHIFVLSGDGTLQAIFEYLAGLPEEGAWRPEFLLLGAGRSNLTPREFGGVPALRVLKAALHKVRAGSRFDVRERPLLRIEQDDARPRHGFFLAGAMIDAGIRLCAQYRAKGTGWIHRGPLSDPICLAQLAVRSALGRSPLPAYPDLSIDAGDGTSLHEPCRILLATTLRRRVGPYNPFAARGAGALRVTAVTAAATHFWRRVPRVLMGSFGQGMDLQHGYLSGSFERADVGGLDGYSLDGEAIIVHPASTLRLRAGPVVRVVQP